MSLREIYNQAVSLLGCSFNDMYSSEHPFLTNPLTLINYVLGDLELGKAESLDEQTSYTDIQVQALSYGMAMFTAMYLGDSEKHSFFTQIYNEKRKKVLCKSGKIKDALPCSEV